MLLKKTAFFHKVSNLETVESIISWSPKKCNEQTILKSAPINIRVVSTAND